jgi:hypothetical protein
MLISLTTLLPNLSSIFHSRAAPQLENLALRVSGELLRGPLSPLVPCESELSLTFGTQDHTW